MSRGVTPWSIALVGSLAVYLIPLIGPHAIWLLGESLLQELTRVGEREPLWLVADLALALAAQAAVGLTLVWSFRGSRLRLLTWIAAVPILVAAVNTVYLIAIPSYFLIEPDTAPEVTGWEEHCLVPNVSLMPVRTSVNQPASGVGEWWVQRPDARYALLRLPDCAVVDADLPLPSVQPGGQVDFMLGFQFSALGGAATIEWLVPRTSERSWWLLSGPAAQLIPIDQPDLVEAAPILSDAADALAWVQRVAGSPRPVLERVMIRPLQASPGFDSLDIELAPFGPASYTLLGVDTEDDEAILWRNGEPLVVGFDGQRRPTSLPSDAVRPQASTYLRLDGWVPASTASTSSWRLSVPPPTRCSESTPKTMKRFSGETANRSSSDSTAKDDQPRSRATPFGPKRQPTCVSAMDGSPGTPIETRALTSCRGPSLKARARAGRTRAEASRPQRWIRRDDSSPSARAAFTLNIGSARDAVYVFRTSDSTEVFRTYLPRYARSQVVFFAGGLFGYSDLIGTRILVIPQ